MKRLIIICSVVLNSLAAFCQESPLDEIFTITLPKGTEKLTFQQFKDFSNTKFSHTEEYPPQYLFYKNNGLAFSFWNMGETKILKKSVESQLQEMIGYLKMHSAIKGIESKIVNVNGIKFSVLKYKKYTDNFITITSDYDSKNRSIYGHIEYIDSDSTKADQFLKDLLNSMHFKNM